MYGALEALILLASWQSGTPVAQPTWPDVKPRSIVRTPDWSDYRLYPMAARRKNQEGRVTAELLVGADGTPRECRIVDTSYYPELDSGTCNLMLKMRFGPPVDSSGNAVPSRFVRRFNWRLTEPVTFASSYLVANVSFEEGRLQDCDVSEGAGPYVAYWSSLACTFLADVPYYYGGRASANAVVEFRLDAGDRADFLTKPWTAKNPAATERISFAINSSGDASNCTAIEQVGFGNRGMNNLSPCGRLLSILWFQKAAPAANAQMGTFETRVFF